MVIVRLYGGLGNQMFQYAAGRAVAHRQGARLGLDVSALARDPQRTYRLDHFAVAGRVLPPQVTWCLTQPSWRRIVRCLPTLVRVRQLPIRHTTLAEQHFSLDPRLLEAPSNVCLDGYWQSEKYFAHIAPIIRRELALREPPDPANGPIAGRIADTMSVSLHVRRGDYATNVQTNAVHGLCSLDYYRLAVKTLVERLEEPRFFVFSDDIPWCLQNLELDYRVEYVAQNGTAKDYADLTLMSQCRHHIIANSSFSWWGAWLGGYSGKTVIAPRAWFNDATLDTRDLIPDSWIRL